MRDLFATLFALAAYVVIATLTVGAMIQHWVTTWANDQLGLFLFGMIFFPVGIIHGWLIWLGIAG